MNEVLRDKRNNNYPGISSFNYFNNTVSSGPNGISAPENLRQLLIPEYLENELKFLVPRKIVTSYLQNTENTSKWIEQSYFPKELVSRLVRYISEKSAIELSVEEISLFKQVRLRKTVDCGGVTDANTSYELTAKSAKTGMFGSRLEITAQLSKILYLKLLHFATRGQIIKNRIITSESTSNGEAIHTEIDFILKAGAGNKVKIYNPYNWKYIQIGVEARSESILSDIVSGRHGISFLREDALLIRKGSKLSKLLSMSYVARNGLKFGQISKLLPERIALAA